VKNAQVNPFFNAEGVRVVSLKVAFRITSLTSLNKLPPLLKALIAVEPQ
jgi:hypothetical protein